MKLKIPNNTKTDDLNSHSAFDGLVWLVRASQKSWVFAGILVLGIGAFFLTVVSKTSPNSASFNNLIAIPLVLSALLGLVIGVSALLQGTAQAQGRSTLGQLGHILKGIALAGFA